MEGRIDHAVHRADVLDEVLPAIGSKGDDSSAVPTTQRGCALAEKCPGWIFRNEMSMLKCEILVGRMMDKRFDVRNPMQVGGQAVLEGVMMRAPGMVATAVRRASGEIVVRKEPHVGLGERYRLLRLPVLRGALGLVEMIVIGMRTLNFSAEVAMLDVEETNGNGHTLPGSQATAGHSWKDSLRLGLTVAISLVAGVAVFFLTPLLITTVFFKVDQLPFTFNLVAGMIRVLFLLGYMFALSMFKDIKRLFQYHGAEHMAVFAFERGAGLDVRGAAEQSRFHPRCGTSFLLIVVIVSVVLFSVLDSLVMIWLGRLTLATRILTHLPLIPLVGGVSYELIKASAKRSETIIGKLIVSPGMWLQRITTQPPDVSQLEVALVALRCALGDEYPPPSSINLPSGEEVPANRLYA